MGKQTRLYGLFHKDANGKWVRESPTLAFKKDAAVRIFQNRLLMGSLEEGLQMALRPVNQDTLTKVGWLQRMEEQRETIR